MVMKDRLTKTGHSAFAYKARRFFVFAMFAGLVTVGVYLTTYMSVTAIAKAQDNTTEVVEDQDQDNNEGEANPLIAPR